MATKATLQDSGVLEAMIRIHGENPSLPDSHIDAELQKEGYGRFRVVRCSETNTYDLFEQVGVLDYTFFGDESMREKS